MYDSGNDDDGDGDDAARESAGGITTKNQNENRGIPLTLARTDDADDGRIAPLRVFSIVRLGVDRRPGPYVSEATAR